MHEKIIKNDFSPLEAIFTECILSHFEIKKNNFIGISFDCGPSSNKCLVLIKLLNNLFLNFVILIASQKVYHVTIFFLQPKANPHAPPEFLYRVLLICADFSG